MELNNEILPVNEEDAEDVEGLSYEQKIPFAVSFFIHLIEGGTEPKVAEAIVSEQYDLEKKDLLKNLKKSSRKNAIAINKALGVIRKAKKEKLLAEEKRRENFAEQERRYR